MSSIYILYNYYIYVHNIYIYPYSLNLHILFCIMGDQGDWVM